MVLCRACSVPVYAQPDAREAAILLLPYSLGCTRLSSNVYFCLDFATLFRMGQLACSVALFVTGECCC